MIDKDLEIAKNYNIYKNAKKLYEELREYGLYIDSVRFNFSFLSKSIIEVDILPTDYAQQNSYFEFSNCVRDVCNKNGLSEDLDARNELINLASVPCDFIPFCFNMNEEWDYKKALFVKDYLLPCVKHIGQEVIDLTYYYFDEDTILHQYPYKTFQKGREIVDIQFESGAHRYAPVDGDSNYGILCDVIKHF